MRTYMVLLSILSLTVINIMAEENVKEPVAKKHPKIMEKHGHKRIDDYYWLNERENPEVIKYLEDENAYLNSKMAHTEAFRESLFNEMVARIKQDDASVPYKKNGYWYYTRYETGAEYHLQCRRKGTLDAPEEIMLNVPEMAKGFSYYQVGGVSVSPDNRLIAFGVDTVSRRQYNIYFKDMETGKIYGEILENTAGYCVWANDNRTVFYTVNDPVTLRSHRIYKHVLGTDPKNDELVFEEKDETFNCGVGKSKSEKYIMISSGSTVSDECHVIEADNPGGSPKLIQPRERDLEYRVYHYGDKFYIITNYKAKNFRLVQCGLHDTGKESWREVLPHRDDVLLEGIDIFRDYLVISERKNALTQVRVQGWNGKTDYYVDFGEEVYSAYTSVNPEYDTDVLRYSYTSLTTPSSVIEINLSTKEKIVLKEQPVLGVFDKNDFETKRLWATAKDGTKIPVSLVYRKGIATDGNNPLLLYGYGSYGNSIDPYFSSARLSLLNRGFIFAIAHIRGGEEMGREWYEKGKMLDKKNTFTDFIDCAEYLVARGYTEPGKMFAYGASAGGLLVGAVLNMRPDLFRGVIAGVPFVDVVTTMLDESIPLTTGEYDEWGNPNEKAYYDYMLSYSPYDNVKPGNYTNVLVTTGLHDSQVQYWEPAKWVAKLRDMRTDKSLLLLHTQMKAGHGGASGRFESLKQTALQYAFIFDLMGIRE